jgi:hypothetical protein
MDTQDKLLLRGQLGEYYKLGERVVVTKNAYFGMGTKDSVNVGKKKIPDTLWLGADTLEAQMTLQKTLKLLNKPIIQKDNEVGADDEKAKAEKEKEKIEAKKQAAVDVVAEKKLAVATPSTKKLTRKERKEAEQKAKELKDNPPPKIITANLKVKTDSLRADSIKKLAPTITKLILPPLKKDSVKVDKKVTAKASDKKITPIIPTNGKAKSPIATNKKDSVIAFNPADTIRARVIKAYHNVRVYKTNMQARADSLFYTAADSTLRWYKNPILWAEGSQQTGDTIHVFFKGDKINSFQVLESAFIVNVETDSTKFNQVKGKRVTGFFTDGDLRTVFVDGNAESIYYSKDDKGKYDRMSQSVSGRIKFLFKENELTDILYIKEDEGVSYTIDKLPKETVLTGFIWKPELRPLSKADIIKGIPTKKTPAKGKTATKPKTTTKNSANDPSGM